MTAGIAADGLVCRHGRHLINWRARADGGITVVAVLHERMDQVGRARAAFTAEP